MAKVLQLQEGEQLQFVDSVEVDFGVQKVKLQETYIGVPVLGQGVVLEITGRYFINKASGSVVKGIARDISSVKPDITAEEAFFIATDLHQDGLDEVLFQPDTDARLQIYTSDHIGYDVVPILVYVLSYLVVTPSQQARPFTIINAHTGEVVKFWNGLATKTLIQRTALYEYEGLGGNGIIGPHVFGLDYPALRIKRDGEMCYMENDFVRIIDDHFGSFTNDTFVFACENGTDDAINGAFSPAADAFFYSNIAYATFADWLETPPITGKSKLEAHVHFLQNFENAFWKGDGIVFGDGMNRFHPFTVLDIAAHEVAHGFTEQHSALFYNGQSGAVNEAFSDLAGVAAEEYFRSTDWYQGAHIAKGGLGHLYRHFQDPSRDGRSINHFSDYCPGLDVHFASGIINRAVYILVNEKGWDVQDIFKMFGLANRLYWTPRSTLAQAVCGLIHASGDLSFSSEDIDDVFRSVGITPCIEPEFSLHHTYSMDFTPNVSMSFIFRLDEYSAILKFEIFRGLFSVGILDLEVTTPDGRELGTQADSTFVSFSLPRPNVGDYRVDIHPTSVSTAAYFYAVTNEGTVAQGINLNENGTAVGSFYLPVTMGMPKNPIAIRIRNPSGFAPMMFLNFAEPVDLYNYKHKAKSHFLKGEAHWLLSELLLCKPKEGNHYFLLQGLPNQIDISLSYHTFLLPKLSKTNGEVWLWKYKTFITAITFW